MNPNDAGATIDEWNKRRIQRQSRKDDQILGPSSQVGKPGNDAQKNRQAEAIINVQRAQKVALLATKFQMTNRTGLIHSQNAAINSPAPAAWAQTPNQSGEAVVRHIGCKGAMN